jgi:RNA recognition motif-containing protein
LKILIFFFFYEKGEKMRKYIFFVVVVGNLNSNVNKKDIYELFNDIDITKIDIPKGKDSIITKGLCYIHVKTENDIEKCINKYNGIIYKNKKILVSRFSRLKTEFKHSRNNSLFFKFNTDRDDTNEDIVRNIFSKSATIVDLTIRKIKKINDKFYGYGFVHLDTTNSILKIMAEINDTTIENINFTVEISNSLRQQIKTNEESLPDQSENFISEQSHHDQSEQFHHDQPEQFISHHDQPEQFISHYDQPKQFISHHDQSEQFISHHDQSEQFISHHDQSEQFISHHDEPVLQPENFISHHDQPVSRFEISNYKNHKIIYQPIQNVYQSVVHQPIQNAYQSVVHQPIQSVHQSFVYQPIQNAYQRQDIYYPPVYKVLQPVYSQPIYRPVQHLNSIYPNKIYLIPNN